MKKCPYCGNENADVASYCAKCGKPLGSNPAQNSASGSQPQTVYVVQSNHDKTGSYIGLTILFLLVGLIGPLICWLAISDRELKRYSKIWFLVEAGIIGGGLLLLLLIVLIAACAA